MPIVKRHKHRRTNKPLTALKTNDKGKAYCKIIGATIVNGREYNLHATKGYRSGRLVSPER